MHDVFFVLSAVSWKTNVTKFSVIFTHKSLYNAGKKSVKMKDKKQTEKKKNGQSRTIKFKSHSQLFSLSTNLIERLDKT